MLEMISRPPCPIVKTLNEYPRARTSDLLIEACWCRTPYGDAYLGMSRGSICFLGFGHPSNEQKMETGLRHNWPAARIRKTGQAETDWDACVTLMVSGTGLQVKVWRALLNVQCGQPISYQSLADLVGRPDAVRAVASAVGANPISWLIPCHRIVRKDGGPGGYRWGLGCKQMLLRAEDANNSPSVTEGAA